MIFMATTADSVKEIDRQLARISAMLRQARKDGRPVWGYENTIDALLEKRISYTKAGEE